MHLIKRFYPGIKEKNISYLCDFSVEIYILWGNKFFISALSLMSCLAVKGMITPHSCYLFTHSFINSLNN
jgi:hypothetical protein